MGTIHHGNVQASPNQEAVLIAPAAIVYSHRKGLPLGRVGRADVAWYGDSEFVPHLFDLVRDGGAECRLSFLDPLPFGRGSDRKAVARQAGVAIRSEVARLLSGIGPIEAEPYVHSATQRV